jgi:hypothetical protein
MGSLLVAEYNSPGEEKYYQISLFLEYLPVSIRLYTDEY